MNQHEPPLYQPLKTAIRPRDLPVNREPRAYVHTRGTSAHAPKGKESVRGARSADLLARKRSKERLINHLESIEGLDAQKMRDRMRACGTKMRMITCGDHVSQVSNHSRCDHRLCPFCAGRRSRKIQRDYLPKIGAFVRNARVPVTPCLLTLTVAHKQGETALEGYTRLYEAFKKLIRRREWKAYFLGGIWVFEIVLGKDGCWHPHLHLIVFRRRFVDDLDGLKNVWCEVTDGSHVLNLQRIEDLKEGAKEVLKYMAKPSDFDRMTPDHIRQLLEFRGKRLFNAFGEFAQFCKTYEVTEEDRQEWSDPHLESLIAGDPCPECGQPVFEMVGTLEEITDLCFKIESRTARARGKPV